jgi:DNA repair photolyase
MFIPKRIYVKRQSRYDTKTRDIIARVKKCNPTVEIINMEPGSFKYPVRSPRDKFLHMKESIIISRRVAPFITTFASPGDIVEDLTTVLNLGWMCAASCEFCYLQTNQTPEHYVYSNIAEAEKYIRVAPVAHAAIQTIWTQISYSLKRALIKIPEGLFETSDELRVRFAAAGINTDSEAVDFYYSHQEWIYNLLQKNSKEYRVSYKEKFFVDRDTIKRWFAENRKYRVLLTCSEFIDLFATDHLTGQANFLMSMVPKYPEVGYKIRTKSAYVDEIIKHDGQGRVQIQMNFNTDHAINTFEHGTASLDERLAAAIKVQQAKGFRLRVIIEPMVYYDGYEQDYKKLIKKIFTSLDPTRIDGVAIGSVRYTKQLKAMVEMHFPKTLLFRKDQKFGEPEKMDKRFRYDEKTRISLYSKAFKEIKKYTDSPVKLGAENPSIWDALGFKKEIAIGQSILQYDGVPIPHIDTTDMKKKTTSKAKVARRVVKQQPEPVNVVDDEDESTDFDSPMVSASSRAMIAYAALSQKNIGVNIEKLYASELELNGLVKEVPQEDGDVYVRDLWPGIEPTAMRDIGREENYWIPMRIAGRIAEITNAEPVKLDDGQYATIFTLSIDNGRGKSIATLPIPLTSLKENVQSLHENHKQCMFHGCVVPVFNSKGKGDFKFFLHEIRTNVKASDLLDEKPSGKDRGTFRYRIGSDLHGIPEDHPYWVVSDHKDFKQRMSHIKSELAKHLNIKALESATQLDRCIEFMVLQALSQGKDVFSLKLHSLVIGPPNVGKGYLTKIALVLNPVGQEVSSSSAKVTAAGMIGSVKARPGKNVSLPGILPSNSGGVVCIQEFHDIVGNKRKEICGVFTRFMEEGQVIDSTSAYRIHEAKTSLHIDQNRYSQIQGDRKAEFNTYSDIAIPMNVLSRFDFIMEIPNDAVRQDEVAGAMGISSLGEQQDEWQALEWERRLKMLIAFLRSETRGVTFSDEINEYIMKRVTELLDHVKEYSLYSKAIQDIQLRFVRSVYKIVKTIACLDTQRDATKAHVDYALSFVTHKLEFITHIKPEDIAEEILDGNDSAARQKIISKEFKGKQFTVIDVMKFLKGKVSAEVSDKTIRRDLGEIGAKTVKKGIWSL